MFGKLNREAMEWATVQACDKAFNYLPGEQFQLVKLLKFLNIE